HTGWNGTHPPLLEQFLPNPSGAVPDTAAGGYIAAGDHFSLFVQGYPYGDLVTWGANESGQLGDGTEILKPSPVYARRWDSFFQTYVRVDSVALVAGGARHGLSAHFERWEYQGCPIVWSWGDNSQGQLGTGSLSPALVKYVQPGLPLRLFYRDQDEDGHGNPADFLNACALPEGFVATALDCDDTNAAFKPGAVEICDGVDNNCDGQVDEGLCASWYRDADGDGFGNANDSKRSFTQPQGYVADSTDCDDTRSNVRPGQAETCDTLDNDCDAQVDEGVCAFWYRDADGDGYGKASDSVQAGTRPAGYVANATDCDDTRANVFPGASEVCDGLDNNCNGQSDEGVGALWYRDADGDGFGNPGSTAAACGQPAGYVANASDCNDSNGSIRPGASEVCDGVDNNCTGGVDEGVMPTFYRDGDGDGYGTGSQSVQTCSQPGGYVSNAGDCNDSNASIRPGATETCDSVDNNCNGAVDDGAGSIWYRDGDGDGYGTWMQSIQQCWQPGGYVSNASDCNDSNSGINPGAYEYCDGTDNNCNGQVDEEGATWYRDADGDGYGNINQSTESCWQPGGYVSNSGDCSDGNPTINPGAPEVCDGVDNNCNVLVDENGGAGTYYRDADGDGYGNPGVSTTACSQPAGYVANAGDCNDFNWSVNSGAPEVCDGADNNCNGAVDEGAGSTWYFDIDNDGYGNASLPTQSCSQPFRHVSNASDCDDFNVSIYPGAPEACDGRDNNCNYLVDEGAGSTWFRDGDGDGYGNWYQSTYTCGQPGGYVSNANDCNDSSAASHPGAAEVCDGVDNNCNYVVDDGAGSTWYRDSDGDGYGNGSQSTYVCGQPSGYVSNASDCDDSNASMSPGHAEVCDGVDNNCNGQVNEGGVCVPACGSQTACGNVCVDTSSDFNNCGGCGLKCPNWKFQCIEGACEYMP
ncbi:MopE-related protein, partial [Corallococcus terminator]